MFCYIGIEDQGIKLMKNRLSKMPLKPDEKVFALFYQIYGKMFFSKHEIQTYWPFT